VNLALAMIVCRQLACCPQVSAPAGLLWP